MAHFTGSSTRAAGFVRALAGSVVLIAVAALGLRPVIASAASAPSLSLSPTSGPVGTVVSASGYNFAASASGTLTFQGAGVTTFATDRKGNFSTRFSVPGTAANGTVNVVAATGALTAAKAFTVTGTARSSTTSSTTPGVLFGVTTPSNPSDLTELDQFETDAGKHVGLYMYYQGWAYDGFNATQAAAVAARGAIPEITWEPWDYSAGVTQPAYSLASIIGGAHDDYITRWALAAKAYGGPLMVRFAHEMNDRYYPWSELMNGNLPGQYVLAWRHVVDIFRSVGAANVRWVWSPNVSYSGTISLAEVYPGDGYVDWVAADGYNGGTALAWGGWLTFSQIFGSTLTELATVAPTKPVMIGETASAEQGGSKATWITDFFAQMAQRPQIQAFVWFNQNKETDWRIESSASATQAFATGVADARYH